MSKELEALENFVRTSVWNDNEFHEIWDNGNYDLEIVKEALQRLESIDNANSSEALEILYNNAKLDRDRIEEGGIVTYAEEIEHNEAIKPYYDTIKQALLKAQEQEKVLKIIKEKRVNMLALIHSIRFENLEYYNDGCFDWDELTQEEFELIGRLAGVKNE